MDASGIRRAIIRLRVIVPTKLRNRCGLCRKCRVAALCEGCPFKGEAFSDPVVANSIIDRLVHHSAIIRITGRSYRIKGLMDEEGPTPGRPTPRGDEGEMNKRKGRPRKDALGKEGGI